MILAQPGKDDGMIPIYALLTELGDQYPVDDAFKQSVANAKIMLENLFDKASPFTDATLQYISNFSSWAYVSITAIIGGGEVEEFNDFGEDLFDDVEEFFAEETFDPEAIALEADVLQEINIERDREILAEFQVEAHDHLEQIEAGLLVLEGDATNSESLNAIFRSFHTLKGVSGFLNLTPIRCLAHHVESVLDDARNGKLRLDSAMITVVLQSCDAIGVLLNQVAIAVEKETQPTEIVLVSHLIIKVKELATAALITDGSQITDSSLTDQNGDASGPELSFLDGALTTEGAQKGESSGKAAGSMVVKQSSIRVNTTKLDNLMDMVGELVIVQSQLQENTTSDDGENSLQRRNLAQLHRITKELQHTSMSLRMVPIQPTFQKMGRLVRDLVQDLGKEVNFEVSGQDTELDRNVIEQIGDPLIHMVRNAIDHGLEDPEVREANGKSKTGNIQLKAYYSGSSVAIELTDDGGGIDPDVILNKAIQKGLISEGQEYSTEEIYQFIFLPGFSTASKVTDISGRGVGMDVVKKNVEQLRGTVVVDSTLGKGSVFKILLPLTMAIIDGLVVKVGNDRFVLPTASVKVAMRPTLEQITTIQGGAEVIDVHGHTVPIIRLQEKFNIPVERQHICDGIVVIIEAFGQPCGLLVEELLSKQEVVIKSLGNMMDEIHGVAGGAILGDGGIALILDPASLLSKYH